MLRLFLLTAGGERNDARVHGALATFSDWNTLLALTDDERAELETYRVLASAPPNAVPEPILAQARRIAQLAEFQAKFVEERLASVVTILNRADITPILYKGAALGLTAYRRFADRSMADIDLIVPEPHTTHAWETLRAEGWRWAEAELPMSKYTRMHHLPPLDDTTGPSLSVEIHRRLFPKTAPFHEQPLTGDDQLRPITRKTYIARCHVSTAQLVIHCIHFSWGDALQYNAWRALRDVNVLVDTGKIDWDGVEHLARSVRARSAVYWPLVLAARYTAAAVPDQTLDRLRPRMSRVAHAMVLKHVLANIVAGDGNCPSVQLNQRMWTWTMRPGSEGHGEARPWHISGDFVDPDSTAAPPRAGAWSHLSRVGAWSAYVGRLLGPAR